MYQIKYNEIMHVTDIFIMNNLDRHLQHKMLATDSDQTIVKCLVLKTDKSHANIY